MDVFPRWEALQFGDALDLVVKILMVDGDRILGTTVHKPCHSLVIVGELPECSSLSDMMLLIGAKVIEVGSIVRCELGQQSCLLPLPICTRESIHQVVELCCGIGAFSSISSEVGLTTLVGVDQNGRWHDLFKALHGNASFLTGDCADPQIITKLYHLGASHAILVAGVSCQPHSLGGDKRGMADPRAASLPKTLHTAWCLQCPLVILECVPGLLTDKDAQQLLRSYCQATGSCITQTVLHLSDSWCAKRDRWFAILSSPAIGPIEIPSMPQQPQFQKIRSVMPFVHSLSAAELQELELSLYELSKFEEFAVGGVSNSYLNLDSVLPTCLHSAGNQLYSCKCGCRGPFSLQRLASKGLYGVLVPLPEVVHHCNAVLQKSRYLHPREMFLLNGGCPNIDMPGDLRLALSGVGQCVSPLQSIWVLSHVVKALEKICQNALVVPEQVFEGYVNKLSVARDAMWPLPEVKPLPIAQDTFGQVALIDHDAGTKVCIKVKDDASVQQLLLAENHLRSDPSNVLQTLYHGVDQMMNDSPLIGQEVAVDRKLLLVDEARTLPCPCEDWDEPMELHKPSESADPLCGPNASEPAISPTVPFQICQTSRQWDGASALLDLDFLDFLVPLKVPQVTCLSTHVRTMISNVNRQALLGKQQTTWADDEIRFVLRNLVHEGPPNLGLVSWDPLMLSSIVRFGHLQSLKEYVDLLPTDAVILSCVIVEKHWYPIVWQKTSTQMFGATCGHQFQISMALQSLHATVCKLLDFEVTQLHYFGTDFPVTECCGAMAMDFLAYQVFGRKMPTTLAELRANHQTYRLVFSKQLPAECSRPWAWAWEMEIGNKGSLHCCKRMECLRRQLTLGFVC